MRCERKTAKRYRRNTKFRLFRLMAFQVCHCRTEWNRAMVCESNATHPSNIWIDGVRAIHWMIHSASRCIQKRWCDRLSWNPLRLKENDRSQIRHSYDLMLFCGNHNEWQFTEFSLHATVSSLSLLLLEYGTFSKHLPVPFHHFKSFSIQQCLGYWIWLL